MRYTPRLLRWMLRSLIREMGAQPEPYVRQPGRNPGEESY